MSYPEIGALVLDASFDDLVPLALKVLPGSWRESHPPRTPPFINHPPPLLINPPHY